MDEKKSNPLSGLRVLELATNVAGPLGATLFAEFGAEVIKVEIPGTGDPARHFAPFYKEKSLTYAVLGRNKKSVTLDLRKPRGQELLKRLVKISDVLTENFRPGTMEKWGLGYEEIKKVNPRIIMVRVSGFGQDGPYKDRAAFDRIASAMGGLTYLTGYPESPPVRVGLNLCDEIAGLFSAFGTMVALYHRDVSDRGKGQWIDVSLCESIIRLLEGVIAEYGKLGKIRERSGNLNEVVAPADNFLSRDGKWIVFVVTSDALFQRFAMTIGRGDLAQDPRLLKNLDRLKNRDALHEIIRPWFQEKTVSEIDKIFGENGVPYGLVYNAKDICEDPQNQFRENIVEVQDPEIGPVQMQSVTPRLSETPGKVRSSSPGLGEHNQEVWGELLGLTEEELEDLGKEGVI
ncbi:MAG TPA: CoA transferase [Thermodesulfobacteriota bacterium]|nr:CoA transferase [Thermodesulfobacteriota bacterium]